MKRSTESTGSGRRQRLADDDFDNGRSPDALRRSFEQSQHVALGWVDGELVGMARLLSDGVCNAYLLDVWTDSRYRRRGVASQMLRHLMAKVPGQHIGLQTDDAKPLYESLGFRHQPEFLSIVAGRGSTTTPTASSLVSRRRGAGRCATRPWPAGRGRRRRRRRQRR